MSLKKRVDKLFLLSWKKSGIVILLWILFVVLHNFVYGIFKSYFDSHGGDEAFFFILAIIVLPAYLVIAMIYSGFVFLSSEKRKKIQTLDKISLSFGFLGGALAFYSIFLKEHILVAVIYFLIAFFLFSVIFYYAFSLLNKLTKIIKR